MMYVQYVHVLCTLSTYCEVTTKMKMNSNNDDDLLLLSELQSKLRSKDYKQALMSFRCIELQVTEYFSR